MKNKEFQLDIKPGTLLRMKRSWTNNFYDVKLNPADIIMFLEFEIKYNRPKSNFPSINRYTMNCLVEGKIKPFGLSNNVCDVFYKYFEIVETQKNE